MSTFELIKKIHVIVVTLFLLIYLIKTILLLINNKEALAKLVKIVKIPEMTISFTFLATGIYLLLEVPEANYFMIIKLACVFISIPVAIIGFKKSNKALAVLSLLLIVGAYGLAEVGAKKRKLGGEQVVSNSVGSEIYLQKCANCHGKDGDAGLSGATDLSLSKIEDNAIIDIIKNGKSGSEMRAFSGELNDEQIKSVADYVKTLRK